MAARYEALIDAIADRERVPRAVAQALVDTENAKRDPSIVIKEAWGGGSFGLTMITLRTAQSLGFTGTPAQLLDPTINVTFGLRYLRQVFDSVSRGDWGRARWAYNVGPDLDPPWPAADKARFLSNLGRWTPLKGNPASPAAIPAVQPGPAPPTFQKPPILRAGIGGWLMPLLILGWVLPMLFRRRRSRR